VRTDRDFLFVPHHPRIITVDQDSVYARPLEIGEISYPVLSEICAATDELAGKARLGSLLSHVVKPECLCALDAVGDQEFSRTRPEANMVHENPGHVCTPDFGWSEDGCLWLRV
jgi:hypothetical protein